jgi:3-phenylpropionate/trans-cinnamate dioxygenase ferredoxin component
MSFRFAIRLADLPKGKTHPIRIADEPVLIARTENDEVFVVENRCSHDGGGFEAGCFTNRTLTCPRHGATFDVSSGKALTMPAVAPIQTYSVRITDEEYVEIDIEDDD